MKPGWIALPHGVVVQGMVFNGAARLRVRLTKDLERLVLDARGVLSSLAGMRLVDGDGKAASRMKCCETFTSKASTGM